MIVSELEEPVKTCLEVLVSRSHRNVQINFFNLYLIYLAQMNLYGIINLFSLDRSYLFNMEMAETFLQYAKESSELERLNQLIILFLAFGLYPG